MNVSSTSALQSLQAAQQSPSTVASTSARASGSASQTEQFNNALASKQQGTPTSPKPPENAPSHIDGGGFLDLGAKIMDAAQSFNRRLMGEVLGGVAKELRNIQDQVHNQTPKP